MKNNIKGMREGIFMRIQFLFGRETPIKALFQNSFFLLDEKQVKEELEKIIPEIEKKNRVYLVERESDMEELKRRIRRLQDAFNDGAREKLE